MRIFNLLIIVAAFVISCNSNEDKAESEERPPWNRTDTVIIWSADADQSTRKRLFMPQDSINIAEPLINGINDLWPEAGVYTKGQRNDTLIIGLRNETWLTDQIGNDGAEEFLSFTAMNLLELKGVNHIYFDLIPGVHAAADTWEDQDFADWKEVAR
ncbi:MAG: hypothetical protein ACK5XN_29400 [Bacteroidota bacterium]|jgi:hypothetical protein